MEFSGTCRRITTIALLSVLLIVVWMTPLLAQELAGKDLGAFYQQNCARCHGTDGSAVDEKGKKLSGRNLTDSNWQRETKDKKMIKTILEGKFFGLAMPAYKKDLTESEVQQMVSEIIRKSKKGKIIAPYK